MIEDENVRGADYESKTGDSEEWGEPIPTKARRRLGAMISVRLTADELDEVRRAAEAQGVSSSAFLRTAALRAARPEAGHLYPVVSNTRSAVETRRSFVSLSTNSAAWAWSSATSHA